MAVCKCKDHDAFSKPKSRSFLLIHTSARVFNSENELALYSTNQYWFSYGYLVPLNQMSFLKQPLVLVLEQEEEEL